MNDMILVTSLKQRCSRRCCQDKDRPQQHEHEVEGVRVRGIEDGALEHGPQDVEASLGTSMASTSKTPEFERSDQVKITSTTVEVERRSTSLVDSTIAILQRRSKRCWGLMLSKRSSHSLVVASKSLSRSLCGSLCGSLTTICASQHVEVPVPQGLGRQRRWLSDVRPDVIIRRTKTGRHRPKTEYRRFRYQPGRTAATVLTRDVRSTTQAEIIAAIPPYRPPREKHARKSTPAEVVLLLSKGLSHWLDDGDQFLSTVVRRIFEKRFQKPSAIEPLTKITLLVAVVDSIAAPSFSWRPAGDIPEIEQSVAESKWLTSLAVQDHGSEGLAYWFDNESELFHGVKSQNPLPQYPPVTTSRLAGVPGNPLDGSPGSILFRFVDSGDIFKKSNTALRVGLANTLFATGTRRVLKKSVWTYDVDSDLLKRQSDYENLHEARVNLRTESYVKLAGLERSPVGQNPFVSLPLRPLTKVRTIKSCMGNIIRELEGLEHGASKELEAAVDQYFVESGKTLTTVAIWALVGRVQNAQYHRQPIRHLFPHGGKPDLPAYGYEVAQDVWHGFRLRKVLSGGGGWGPHAGLISLDPANSFVGEGSTGGDDVPDIEDILSDKPKPLVKNLVEPSDTIRFYMAIDDAEPPSPPIPEADLSRTPARTLSLDFGVLPTADQFEPTSNRPEGSISSQKIEAFAGHFGAMSEAGMILHHSHRQGNRNYSGSCKIDVPYSRFKIQQSDPNFFGKSLDDALGGVLFDQPLGDALGGMSFRKVTVLETMDGRTLVPESRDERLRLAETTTK